MSRMSRKRTISSSTDSDDEERYALAESVMCPMVSKIVLNNLKSDVKKSEPSKIRAPNFNDFLIDKLNKRMESDYEFFFPAISKPKKNSSSEADINAIIFKTKPTVFESVQYDVRPKKRNETPIAIGSEIESQPISRKDIYGDTKIKDLSIMTVLSQELSSRLNSEISYRRIRALNPIEIKMEVDTETDNNKETKTKPVPNKMKHSNKFYETQAKEVAVSHEWILSKVETMSWTDNKKPRITTVKMLEKNKDKMICIKI